MEIIPILCAEECLRVVYNYAIFFRSEVLLTGFNYWVLEELFSSNSSICSRMAKILPLMLYLCVCVCWEGDVRGGGERERKRDGEVRESCDPSLTFLDG